MQRYVIKFAAFFHFPLKIPLLRYIGALRICYLIHI